MGKDGLGKKLFLVAAAAGAILLVLRIVGGRGGKDVGEDAIDRVDTGRSDEETGGGSVETGLERVSTSDADEDDGEGDGEDDEDPAADEASEAGEASETEETAETDEEDEEDEISVVATGGRFDDLDLFDYVAILGAGVEAAREEYRNRS